ncbi:MAG: hypothetical protein F6K62_10505 [Sphaerospermopsis sp. SIO1G2]|nr:hypothetical protein [Sphaerospermopsis sp. SIO1G2]
MLSSLRKTWQLGERIFSQDSQSKIGHAITSVTHGDMIIFGALDQPDLSQQRCMVGVPTIYHFPTHHFTAFPLYSTKHILLCYMIVAEQGGATPYLALSKKVPDTYITDLCMSDDVEALERGDMPDSLYVREYTARMPDWLYVHYEAALTGVRGTSIAANDKISTFDYTLYLASDNHKALEIERDISGALSVYATIFCPLSDVIDVVKGGAVHYQQMGKDETVMPAMQEVIKGVPPMPPAVAPRNHQSFHAKEVMHEPSQPAIPPIESVKKNNDSAQILELPMHTGMQHGALRSARYAAPMSPHASPANATANHKVQCNLRMAAKLVDEALRNDMRVGDVMRKALGLAVNQADHVAFDLQLSAHDYRILAERFDLDALQKDQIHALIMEELGHFTGEPNLE